MRKPLVALLVAVASIGLVAPTAASAAPSAARTSAAVAFPSPDSVLGTGVSFFDATQVGWFWNQDMDQTVSQTVSGPKKIKKAVLKIDITTNAVTAGNYVDFALSINGSDVGTFRLPGAEPGLHKVKLKFPKIKGGTYDVEMRVVSTVPPGEGSMALRYDGDGPHSIKLKRK